MLQAGIIVSSIVLIPASGIHQTGGIVEVWDRAVHGGRIFPPKYVVYIYNKIYQLTILFKIVFLACLWI